MIQNLTFNNPITEREEILSIEIVDYDDYQYWQFVNYLSNIEDSINGILFDLDCTREYKSGRSNSTTSFSYKDSLSKYMRIINTIVNPFLYNYYIDKLIEIHITNILYEFNYPINMLKLGDKKQRVANEFIRHETTDVFTGEVTYIYDNLKTGESITSKDPNLLSTLNSDIRKKRVAKESRKKEKKEKEKVTIMMKDIIFKF